jgi:hypothetical protein
VLIEAALVALPFLLWFAYAAWVRRTGRELPTPWFWLFAVGAVIAALALMATAFFHTDNRDETYVPAEATASGRVTEGHFEPK